MVEMLRVDIGDDGDFGRKLEEGAVGLVGLDHHPLALAHPGIGAIGIDDAAIDDGRVEPARIQQRADHRRGCGLAMRAAHGDRIARRISSASISARRTTGSSFSRAAISSGLVFLIAVETTTTSASPRLSALWPTWTSMPLARRRWTLALSAWSEPCTLWPRLCSTSAMPLMPMPPMPMKWTSPMLLGIFMLCDLP